MADQVFTMSIPSDDDGFVSLQCSFCNERFKLTVEDFEEEDLVSIFCPYCGLSGEGSEFLTDEVLEQAQVIAENYLKSIINDFTKDLEKSFRGNKGISFKAGKKLPIEEDKTLFEPEDMEVVTPNCCELPIKVRPSGTLTGVYCPFCRIK